MPRPIAPHLRSRPRYSALIGAAAGWLALPACGGDETSIWQSDGGGSETTAGAGATGTAAGATDTTAAGSGGTTQGVDSAGTGTATVAADSTGGAVFDVPNGDSSGVGACGCDLRYIWIANADEGTLSKVDTASITEVGRYWTREDHAGDPS
ncbi:MAG: hypothetical protein AAF721_37250, partial [Myxococcota bacterium]